jgi:murein DD-endopeptidase MepM/ murein hydrolase activator NlpD
MNRNLRVVAACGALALLVAGCAIPERYLDRSGAAGGPGAATATARSVTVQQGDTVNAIARRLGVSPQALIEANRLQAPYTLRVGQALNIPGAPTELAAAPGTEDETGPAPVSAPSGVERIDAAPLAAPSGAAPTPTQAAPGAGPPAQASQPTQTAAAPPAAGAVGRFRWPLQGRVVADFGPRTGGAHNDGINIEAPRGTPFVAADAGEVIYVGNELRGFGNLVLIRHANGWVTAYAHADEVMVQRGTQVRRGQTIGRVGTSGNVRTPQLHFEVRRGTRPVNPREHLEGAS